MNDVEFDEVKKITFLAARTISEKTYAKHITRLKVLLNEEEFKIWERNDFGSKIRALETFKKGGNENVTHERQALQKEEKKEATKKGFASGFAK
jgi:hypothetical protein